MKMNVRQQGSRVKCLEADSTRTNRLMRARKLDDLITNKIHSLRKYICLGCDPVFGALRSPSLAQQLYGLVRGTLMLIGITNATVAVMRAKYLHGRGKTSFRRLIYVSKSIGLE